MLSKRYESNVELGYMCPRGLFGRTAVDRQSGFQRHRHFVGLFDVPVQAQTQGQPFYTVIPRYRPI